VVTSALAASSPAGVAALARRCRRAAHRGLVLLRRRGIALTGLQPQSGGLAGIYVVVVVARHRLPRTPALSSAALALAGEIVVIALTYDEPGGTISGLLFSVVPWFASCGSIRRLARSRDTPRRWSRSCASRARARRVGAAGRARAAGARHARRARPLAVALALQLEGTRLLARDRGADPRSSPRSSARTTSRQRADRGAEAIARCAATSCRPERLAGRERERCDVITGTPPTTPPRRAARLPHRPGGATNVRNTARRRVELRLDYETTTAGVGSRTARP
jgi:hypothetical protein